MDVDEQIRQQLRHALTPVNDVAAARREISRRAAGLQHRRQWNRVSAVAAAAAALAAIIGGALWVSQPAAEQRPPVIAPSPDGVPSPTSPEGGAPLSCDRLRVGDELGLFLDMWTEGLGSTADDVCVLTARLGPVPRFDTSDLGTELRLVPGDLPDDFEPPAADPLRQRADGYPVVHLGRIEGTDTQMFLEWRLNETRAPVACVEGTCVSGELPTSETGVYGIGRGGSGLTMTVWTTPDAAVVSLEIEGQQVAWQRPAATVSHLLVDGYRPQPDASFLVRVLDADGDQIATHGGRLGE